MGDYRNRIVVTKTGGGGTYRVDVGFGGSPLMIHGLSNDQKEAVVKAINDTSDYAAHAVQSALQKNLGL